MHATAYSAFLPHPQVLRINPQLEKLEASHTSAMGVVNVPPAFTSSAIQVLSYGL